MHVSVEVPVVTQTTGLVRIPSGRSLCEMQGPNGRYSVLLVEVAIHPCGMVAFAVLKPGLLLPANLVNWALLLSVRILLSRHSLPAVCDINGRGLDQVR